MNFVHRHHPIARIGLATAAVLTFVFGRSTRPGRLSRTKSGRISRLAYWRFEDAPAAADANEPTEPHDEPAASETGNHAAQYRGAVAATAGVPGIGGQAAVFQTPGAHVWVPPHPALDGNAVSVEFWFSSTQAFPDRYWPGSAHVCVEGHRPTTLRAIG